MSKKSGRQSPVARKTDDYPGEAFVRIDETTLTALDVGIYVVDAALNLVFINKRMTDLLGKSPTGRDELIGKPLAEVFPGLGEDIFRAYKRVLKTGKPVFKRSLPLNPGKRSIIAELRIVALTQTQKDSHVLTTLRDITESIRMREALEESEKKYRLLVENVRAHISIIGRDGRILFINETAAQAFKKTPKEIEGQWLRDFFPEANAEKQMAYIGRAIDQGIGVTDKMQTKIRDKWRWVDFNIQPYQDPRGTTTAAMVIAIDITEYRTTEDALRASEEQSRLLIDNVQADIAVVDYDGNFLFINKSSGRNLGISPESVSGRNQREFFPPEAAERQIRNVRRVIDSKEELREEVSVFLGGRQIWFDINVQPFRDPHSDVKKAMIIAIDITHRRQAEQALRESEERFRLQFAALPIPAYIWEHTGDDFVLTSYNNEAEKITKGGIPKFVGKTLTEIYSRSPHIVEDMHRCFNEKATIIREMPYYMVSTDEHKFLRVFYVYIPPNTVVVHTEDITERRQAAEELQTAHDELDERVKVRTRELADAMEALRVEREALEQKNIALREVLDQIEEGKKQLASQIQSNINRIVVPVLKSLERKIPTTNKKYINLLHTSLNEITSPLIGALEAKFRQLTPRELEVCNLVKSGMSSKEIAETFSTSVQTVLKQRAAIRRKLGIARAKTNLVSYLKSLE